MLEKKKKWREALRLTIVPRNFWMLRTRAQLWTMNPYSCFSFLWFCFFFVCAFLPFRVSRVQYPLIFSRRMGSAAALDERTWRSCGGEAGKEDCGSRGRRCTRYQRRHILRCAKSLCGRSLGAECETKQHSAATCHKNWKRSAGSINLHSVDDSCRSVRHFRRDSLVAIHFLAAHPRRLLSFFIGTSFECISLRPRPTAVGVNLFSWLSPGNLDFRFWWAMSCFWNAWFLKVG